jgi:hypothetical protein
MRQLIERLELLAEGKGAGEATADVIREAKRLAGQAKSGVNISGKPSVRYGVRQTIVEWKDGDRFVRVIGEKAGLDNWVQVLVGEYEDGGPSFNVRSARKGQSEFTPGDMGRLDYSKMKRLGKHGK